MVIMNKFLLHFSQKHPLTWLKKIGYDKLEICERSHLYDYFEYL